MSTGLSYGFLNSPIYLGPWILVAQSDVSTPRHKRGPGNPEWCPIPGRSISAIPGLTQTQTSRGVSMQLMVETTGVYANSVCRFSIYLTTRINQPACNRGRVLPIPPGVMDVDHFRHAGKGR